MSDIKDVKLVNCKVRKGWEVTFSLRLYNLYPEPMPLELLLEVFASNELGETQDFEGEGVLQPLFPSSVIESEESRQSLVRLVEKLPLRELIGDELAQKILAEQAKLEVEFHTTWDAEVEFRVTIGGHCATVVHSWKLFDQWLAELDIEE